MLIAILIIIQLVSKSQSFDFKGKKIDLKNICDGKGFMDDKDAHSYLDKICDAAGIANNFLMVPCSAIDNCVAINRDGDAFILYDNQFFNKLKSISLGFITEKKISSTTTQDWQALTILAHEIGHHLNQHFSKSVLQNVSRIDLELQADEYSGGIMYKLGASLIDAESVFNALPEKATLTHPGRTARLTAFEKGFNKVKKKAVVADASIADINNVQIPAEFPGGLLGWTKFLEQNLYRDVPIKNKAPVGKYTVVVSFIVDKNGFISDVQAENDPGYGTKEEAVRVIKNGPSWKAAIQNGRNVTYRHKQSITFVVSEK